jgi:hypothetical protein
LFEPRFTIDKGGNITMEGNSAADSISYPVSGEAATSHGTGSNLIPPKADDPDSREQISTDTNPMHSVTSADLNGDYLRPQYDAVNGDSLHIDQKAAGDRFVEQDDDASVDSRWSESTTVPRRNLGFIQTTSLMLNSVIGGGIFNTPGYVLALTRSKRIALVLWAVGGIYSGLA